MKLDPLTVHLPPPLHGQSYSSYCSDGDQGAHLGCSTGACVPVNIVGDLTCLKNKKPLSKLPVQVFRI